MHSKCPSCKTQIEHEDYLFEVKCEKCGMRFNPFYDAMQATADAAQAAPSSMGEQMDTLQNNSQSISMAEDFSESNNAFADVREFGESLDIANPDPNQATAPPITVGLVDTNELQLEAAQPSASFSTGNSVPADSSDGPLMTAGEAFQGYRVEKYLPPISVWIGTDGDANDPLKRAYEALWGRCTQSDGNGILAIKWSITPDGAKVVMSGTPVRLARG